jgi:hypothetical protein
MGAFIIGLLIGLGCLVGCIGYLYSNGSTLIWSKPKK